jgi:hypothetical protein
MVQLPVLLRAIVAEETPPVPFDTGSTDWLPATMEQAPVVLTALKLTCWPFAAPFDSAVAETVRVEVEIETELGNMGGPRTIVWLFVITAGGEGALCPGDGSIGTGSRVVAIV